MAIHSYIQHLSRRRSLHVVLIAAISFIVSACTSPHNVDVTLKNTPPTVKTTSFNQAIYDLGMMTEIYETDTLHIMARDVLDNTGTSIATSAEIPRDITEMLKSTLNAFGGNILYIPYDPEFILNSANTGYSGFNTKAMPNVIVSGGITEFDRGLETRGKGTEFSLEGSVDDETIGLDFGTQSKQSTASITLDFNMINFETLTGIPRIQAINNIKVHKAMAEDSLGFSISGNAIGLQGNVKKIQGRHAAVRLLVQVSMIQLIGKHLQLPYWRLIPNTEADPFVVDSIMQDYFAMEEHVRVSETQKLLVLHGHDIAMTGNLNEETLQAIAAYQQQTNMPAEQADDELYFSLYSNLPINRQTLQKKRLLAKISPKPSAPANTLVSEDGILHINTNGKYFKIGDAIEVSFSLAAPRYVRIYNLSSNGEVWNLYPGEQAQDALLSAGTSVSIPNKDAAYKLEVTGPAGTDQILAVASRTPFDTPAGQIKDRQALASYFESQTASVIREDIIIE